MEEEIKKVGQGLKAWQDYMGKAVYGKGYRTLYSMDAQEARMPLDKAEITKALMDAIVDAVCTAIDNYAYVPSKLNIALDYETYDVDVIVTIRKRGPDGPEENSSEAHSGA